jgi:hypothetical protein
MGCKRTLGLYLVCQAGISSGRLEAQIVSLWVSGTVGDRLDCSTVGVPLGRQQTEVMNMVD